MWTRVGSAHLALLLAAVAVRADDAVRRDGTQVEGRLSLTATGRFAFTSEPITNLEFVRFKVAAVDPPAAALRMHVRLADGEILLAEVVKLDATHLHVRPPWGGPLAIPRPAIGGLSRSPVRIPRPWADLTADGVRSPDGDETFGLLTTIDPARTSRWLSMRTRRRTCSPVVGRSGTGPRRNASSATSGQPKTTGLALIASVAPAGSIAVSEPNVSSPAGDRTPSAVRSAHARGAAGRGDAATPSIA
ncbi:MAG TPA: hypothetical protein VM597_30915, partial [Gemmataceae bacterium]|nr:hypothetical protein [Gemmataceae bacterium]